MNAHIKILLGLALAAIFVYRAMEALNEPGMGVRELYVLGGFFFAGVLIYQGLKGLRAQRQEK